jgi:hypothetical protein
MDGNEIRDWRDDAAAHAERHLEAWPDVEAYIGGRAAQMWVADPTHSDIQTFDHDKAVQYWTAWAELTDYSIDVTNMFLSVDGVAYEERWPGLWPTDTGWEVPGPKDPAGMGALETLWFEDGLAVRGDVWYPPEENELFGFGCFLGTQFTGIIMDRFTTAEGKFRWRKIYLVPCGIALACAIVVAMLFRG